jgi:hypothetical protein
MEHLEHPVFLAVVEHQEFPALREQAVLMERMEHQEHQE